MVSAASADKWSRLARASPNGNKLSELFGCEAEGLRSFSRRRTLSLSKGRRRRASPAR